LRKWYSDFDQFLLISGVKQPFEAGFPLCVKTGKVLALKNAKNVYGTCSDC
jgi:hypothetical protein